MLSRFRKSLFWQYVLMCTLVIAVSGIIVGFFISKAYVQSINNHREKLTQAEADHAVSDLNNQLESMHQLSLKLSIQPIYQQSYFKDSVSNKINVAASLSQYRSYADLAKEFALLYRHADGSVTVFRSKGETSELGVFLKLYGIEDSDELRFFLFDDTERGRIWNIRDGLLIAFPVSMNAYKYAEEGGTLLFIFDADTVQKRIALSGNLQSGNYSLSYKDAAIIANILSDETVSAGSEEGFSIEANVGKTSIASLISSSGDLFIMTGCMAVLLIFVLFLAWKCYKPILSLANKYPLLNPAQDMGNELDRIEQAIESIRSRSDQLDKKNASQANLLQSYVLLMLLNNARTQNISEELKKVGIAFSFERFFVVTIAAAADQVVTSRNIELLSENLGDIAEDNGILYSVECSTSSHILAILCNVSNEEQRMTILHRLRVFLNRQPIKFIIGEGPVSDSFAGISASYLAALSQFRYIHDSNIPSKDAVDIRRSESSRLADQIISQIECGSCQEALINLERYIEEIEADQSELSRRYTVMDITYSIRQLCTKLDYQLSKEQLSILLSMGNVQSIHFALLQLIPCLCICAQEKNTQGVITTDKLVMDYLSRHYMDYDISVQKIAEAIGIGINRTGAIIKENTGHSLKTVITSMRVEEAKRLLKETSTSVADISTALGYSGASYFIKIFKASENMTPDAYRKLFNSKNNAGSN